MGRDKAALLIGGEPLWRHQLATLRAIEPAHLLVSGPLDGPWAGSDVKVIPDSIANAGPLAGLSALLEQLQDERLVLLGVDLPAMSAEYLRRLLDACSDGRGMVPVLGGNFEPLAAVYPRAMRELVQRALGKGELSLQRVIRDGLDAGLFDTCPVTERERPLFRNVNTPSDLSGLAVVR